ncbi:type VI secretion system membrane subunit TssM [Brucella gallinifaecis]|uniref:Type VI secretion system membrane subunit TssM n=1 Tax=Brucella gallinifaecis TaxID=215590 RepID=A0A502BGS2_9HYPH|nr:type VI secretion system membrane subunit TssM [Brucella gallinifaecis]TPF74012.1 type VI secretion system membrane subunit TssM [Brucella gallinifaecis]
MLGKLFSIITSRLLWGFLGITLLAFIIWVIGPLIAIGDYRPLESELCRQIVIGAIYLIWILCRLIPYLYNARFNGRLLSNLHAAVPVGAENKPEIKQNNQLAQRFSEAAQLLKKVQFARSRGHRTFRWLTRFGREHVYQLPWYVVVGAPGSGKTSALFNSGLDFPLKNRFGPSMQPCIDGSCDCNWWFTNDAVLLDTAGRYATQDKHFAEDASEWNNFVALLKKYRPRQPINGVVMTISVADLLSNGAEARTAQANALRKRLIELHERLGINFPIYVLVTKTDMLEGFAAYFHGLDEAQRNQIWGFTIPWEQSRQAEFDLQATFASQYALLCRRLDAALPDRLLKEHDTRRCAESYLFPQEFAALNPLLTQYLNHIFATSNFTPRFMPRGIYFTSSRQKGAPLGRRMSALNPILQTPLGVQKSQIDTDRDDAGHETAAQTGQSRSFFLKDTLERLVLREPGLASSNRWWEYRNRVLHWIGYATFATILTILALFWWASYDNNKVYLTEVAAKVPSIERQGQSLRRIEDGDMFSLLPFLNSALHLPDSQNFSLNDPPITYRMGLFRGKQIDEAGDTLYKKILKELLLPNVAKEISSTLLNDNHNDTDFSYEALKAYQMLYLPKHYDGKFLQAWVMLNLRRNLSQGRTQQELEQIEWHLNQLLDTQPQTSPFAENKTLVEQAQIALSRIPLPQRIYGRLKRLLLQRNDIRPVSQIDLTGPQVALVLSRKSGKSVTEGVPGLFTAQGYWRLFNNSIEPVTDILCKEDEWVLGSRSSQQNSVDLIKTIRQLYMQDFIAVWDDLLSDIQLVSIDSLPQRINIARLLSGNSSPMRNLLVNVSKNVMLRDEKNNADTRSLLAKTEDRLHRSANRTLEMLFMNRPANADGDVSVQPEQLVMAHFEPLLELAQNQAEGNKVIQFDSVLKLVDELYSYMTAVQDAANSGTSAPESDIITRLQAASNRLPTPFKQMLLSLAIGASSDARSTDMENIKKQIGFEIGSFCQRAVVQRYPLAAHAREEVRPDDLARMFAPNSGLMDNFFRNNLQGKVDTTRANWRFTPGVDGKTLPGDQGLLVSFQEAQYIRDTFFAYGSATPSFRVTVRPGQMDNDILGLTLDVDGQLLKYSHGPLVPLVISWPGPHNTNQVRLQLTLTNGRTANLSADGPWALNRLIDMALISSDTDGPSRQATFNIDGHHVTLEFTPNSIHNPFQLPTFSCPSA